MARVTHPPIVNLEVPIETVTTGAAILALGSGYPYGKDDPTTISGTPSPHDLSLINNTMGSNEHGLALDPMHRARGELVAIPLKTKFCNITNDELHYIIGDRDPALFVMIDIGRASCRPPCGGLNSCDTKLCEFENVIRYYRASGFALAYSGSNNPLAAGNTSTELTTSTPLPEVVM